jgi:acid phosphatase family membrane protein YuiD
MVICIVVLLAVVLAQNVPNATGDITSRLRDGSPILRPPPSVTSPTLPLGTTGVLVATSEPSSFSSIETTVTTTIRTTKAIIAQTSTSPSSYVNASSTATRVATESGQAGTVEANLAIVGAILAFVVLVSAVGICLIRKTTLKPSPFFKDRMNQKSEYSNNQLEIQNKAVNSAWDIDSPSSDGKPFDYPEIQNMAPKTHGETPLPRLNTLLTNYQGIHYNNVPPNSPSGYSGRQPPSPAHSADYSQQMVAPGQNYQLMKNSAVDHKRAPPISQSLGRQKSPSQYHKRISSLSKQPLCQEPDEYIDSPVSRNNTLVSQVAQQKQQEPSTGYQKNSYNRNFGRASTIPDNEIFLTKNNGQRGLVQGKGNGNHILPMDKPKGGYGNGFGDDTVSVNTINFKD